MGKKLYQSTEDGGIQFKTERRVGDVRIPNYIYDLWMPLLGSDVIGVYAVLCRLEYGSGVKGITMQTLANACRMGKTRFMGILETLDKCDFIDVKKPEGQARLWHYTTEITVKDPAQEISKEIIEEYQPTRGYEPLTPWLVRDDTEIPNGTSGETKQYVDDVPNSTSTVESSILHPLVVEEESCANAQPPQDTQDTQDAQAERSKKPTPRKRSAKQQARDEMSNALLRLCFDREPEQWDTLPSNDQSNIGKATSKWLRAKATPNDIQAFGQWWYTEDWRGKKGEAPSLAEIGRQWGRFKKQRETRERQDRERYAHIEVFG